MIQKLPPEVIKIRRDYEQLQVLLKETKESLERAEWDSGTEYFRLGDLNDLDRRQMFSWSFYDDPNLLPERFQGWAKSVQRRQLLSDDYMEIRNKARRAYEELKEAVVRLALPDLKILV